MTTNCQAGCNVEDCGYDIGDLTNLTTWDCCPEACLIALGATPDACPTDEACNSGACNFYRASGTDIGACCVPGNDADGNAIDCATVAGNGTCDEACNTGACNDDGGDCE